MHRTSGFVAGVLVAINAQAAPPVPYTFSAGTPAKAAEVNANFTSVIDQVSTVERDVATLKARVESDDTKLSALEKTVTAIPGRMEAERITLAGNVVTGVVSEDPTASGGKARFGAAGGATGPSGRLFGVLAGDLGDKLGTGLTRVSFRLKVSSRSSSAALANVSCSAVRAGETSWTSLASVEVRPANFSDNLAWAIYTLVCDWRADDADQFVGVEKFALGIADLFIDYLQFQPVVESTVGLVTILGPNLGDQRNNASKSAFGSWYTVPGRTLDFVKRYPASKLKVTYQDTLGSQANGYGACQWRILLDGNEIAHLSAADLDRTFSWMMENVSHVAWVTAASAGRHTLVIQNKGGLGSSWSNPGVNECLMGWNTTSNFLSVEELP